MLVVGARSGSLPGERDRAATAGGEHGDGAAAVTVQVIDHLDEIRVLGEVRAVLDAMEV